MAGLGTLLSAALQTEMLHSLVVGTGAGGKEGGPSGPSIGQIVEKSMAQQIGNEVALGLMDPGAVAVTQVASQQVAKQMAREAGGGGGFDVGGFIGASWAQANAVDPHPQQPGFGELLVRNVVATPLNEVLKDAASSFVPLGGPAPKSGPNIVTQVWDAGSHLVQGGLQTIGNHFVEKAADRQVERVKTTAGAQKGIHEASKAAQDATRAAADAQTATINANAAYVVASAKAAVETEQARQDTIRATAYAKHREHEDWLARVSLVGNMANGAQAQGQANQAGPQSTQPGAEPPPPGDGPVVDATIYHAAAPQRTVGGVVRDGVIGVAQRVAGVAHFVTNLRSH